MDTRRQMKLLGALLVWCLIAGSTMSLAPAAQAAKRCSVTNDRTGARYLSNLQGAIDSAAAGDTIRIVGRCVGTFVITKDLTLRGASRHGLPTVTLDAGGHSPTVEVLPPYPPVPGTDPHPNVTLTDLRITGASGGGIGGIGIERSNVTLGGSTTVSGNSAYHGAGVYVDDGTLTLTDNASVRGNSATYDGGGIFLDQPCPDVGSVWLFMNGTSTVRDNQAGGNGGGIYNSRGAIEMYDFANGSLASTVTGNTAVGLGGGIYDARGDLYDVISYPNSSYNVFGNSPADVDEATIDPC
jgi:nitrous oxidase accessory protein NosD